MRSVSKVYARLAALGIAASCIVGCTGQAIPHPALSGVNPLGGGSLVNEADEILHAAIATANDMSLLATGLMTGGNPPMAVCDLDSSGWTADKRLTVTVQIDEANHCIGQPFDILVMHYQFGDAVYVDGEVDVGDCRKLPGAGTKTTGEYRELTNDTPKPVERTISHTVEESHSEETSLSETLDLTQGTDIEAGAEFPGGSAKATEHFETHFGIEHGSVASDSSTHSETVEDRSIVDPSHIVGAAFTLNDSVVLCAIKIASVVDFASIDIDIWRHDCGDSCGHDNQHTLENHGVISRHGRTVSLSFDGVDAMRQLATGHDTRCDGCTFDLGYWAKHGLSNLGYPHHAGRAVNLNAERRTTVKDSASVIFRDITGLDTDCVADVLTTEGTPVSALDDKLGEC